jgi:hypothetical protein
VSMLWSAGRYLAMLAQESNDLYLQAILKLAQSCESVPNVPAGVRTHIRAVYDAHIRGKHVYGRQFCKQGVRYTRTGRNCLPKTSLIAQVCVM